MVTYYDNSLTNMIEPLKEFFTKYLILGSVIILLNIAAVVLGIIAGISMIRDDEKAAGIPTLILALIGIFVPVCSLIALIIAGVMSLKEGVKGFGIGCISVVAGHASMIIVMIAMYLNLIVSGVGSATAPAASFRQFNMRDMLSFDIDEEQSLTVEVEMEKPPVDVEFFDPDTQLLEVYAAEDSYAMSLNGGWVHEVNQNVTRKTYYLDDCKAGTWTLRFTGQTPVSVRVTGANGIPSTWTPQDSSQGAFSYSGSGTVGP